MRTYAYEEFSYNEKEMGKSPRNVFTGRCDSCGELYEAETSLEDLEGVHFDCKKMICKGKVELRYSGPEDSFPRNGDKTPRRYC